MNMSNDVLVRSNGGPAPAPPAAVVDGNQIVLFDRTWTAAVLGRPLSVELRIISQDSRFIFQIVSDVVGERQSFAFAVNADTTQRIALPYGLTLEISITEWKLAAAQLSFRLGIAVGLPFGLPGVPVANLPVAIPLRTADEVARAALRPQSVADFAAILQLAAPAGILTAAASTSMSAPRRGLPGGAPVTGRALRPISYTVVTDLAADAQTIRELASSTTPYGYGGSLWGGSQNVRVDAELFPIGSQRVGDADVFLTPGSGGWCKFLRWVDPNDSTDGRFFFHVGWSGTQGGSVNWVINGYPSAP